MTHRLLKFAAVLAGVGFAYTYPRYQREKKAALDRLRAGSQIFQSPSGELEYQVAGDGQPILVIHGAGGGYEQGMLLTQVFDLTRYKIIAISRPGYRLTPLATGIRPEDQADAACTLLDHLGIERAIVLAISAGGLSSLQLAVRHPDRCAALVLLSAVTPAILTNLPGAHMVPLMRLLMSSDYVLWLILRLGTRALMLSMGKIDPAQLQSSQNRRIVDQMLEGFIPSSDWRTGTINDIEQVYDMNPNLTQQVSVPTLVIHGTNDTAVPYTVAQATAGAISDARLLTIEGGTHLIGGTHVPEIRAAIDAFVGELK